ncbi:hypothetical protein [Bdellovibrio sp. HCB337]|uniref:hypothetical protein n=1 Tax=Bdellovibrio sp. HCB337 TaxID=3394358 RepID=UPI0039A4577A
MEMRELEQSIDRSLTDEFDAIVTKEFCSKPGIEIKSIETSNKHNIGYEPNDVWRRIRVDLEQSVTFAKVVTQGNDYPPVSITISSSAPPTKGTKWFSFTDLCAIFLPQDRYRVTGDWRKTFQANLQTLSLDLPNLYETDIHVSIAGEDPREQVPNFWEQEATSLKHKFYASAYPILKTVVAKGVPDITIAARWGSDSPYQRYKDPVKWALLSFRYTKRQQVDIVQYVEGRKIRFKCALLDLGFLENGYGKVAKIKEVISMDVDTVSGEENVLRVQGDFLARVAKELPAILG